MSVVKFKCDVACLSPVWDNMARIWLSFVFQLFLCCFLIYLGGVLSRSLDES